MAPGTRQLDIVGAQDDGALCGNGDGGEDLREDGVNGGMIGAE